MSEEQHYASLDVEAAKLVEKGAGADTSDKKGAEDVELTDEELAGVAGGSLTPLATPQPALAESAEDVLHDGLL
jgi:hypothetical protein